MTGIFPEVSKRNFRAGSFRVCPSPKKRTIHPFRILCKPERSAAAFCQHTFGMGWCLNGWFRGPESGFSGGRSKIEGVSVLHSMGRGFVACPPIPHLEAPPVAAPVPHGPLLSCTDRRRPRPLLRQPRHLLPQHGQAAGLRERLHAGHPAGEQQRDLLLQPGCAPIGLDSALLQ